MFRSTFWLFSLLAACATTAWAKATYMDFVAALHKKAPTAEGFAIKKAFPAGDSFEHMWLSDVVWDGKVFKGTVNNDPVETKVVKFGQRITVKPDELSDWMYIDDGVLKGGNTIRVFYGGMKPKDKKEFEAQMPFKIPAVDF